MTRFLLLIPLGLSLLSCDKPDGGNLGKLSDGPIHETRSIRHQAISLDSELLESAASDPVEELGNSLVLAEAMPCSVARDKALAEVAWNAMETHPETAREAFLQLSENSPEILRLVRHYAMRSAAENPDEAIKWAVSLGSEHEISAAISHIALEVAAKDPVRAANLLFDFGLDGHDFDVAVVQVVQRWAASSPPDAVAWVEKFAAGNVRQASLQAVFERWLVQDGDAATQWAESIHDTTLRREAESAISSVLIQQPDSTRKRWMEENPSGFLEKISTNTKGATD